MTHRGPFQPLPFCDSVKHRALAGSTLLPSPAYAAGLPGVGDSFSAPGQVGNNRRKTSRARRGGQKPLTGWEWELCFYKTPSFWVFQPCWRVQKAAGTFGLCVPGPFPAGLPMVVGARAPLGSAGGSPSAVVSPLAPSAPESFLVRRHRLLSLAASPRRGGDYSGGTRRNPRNDAWPRIFVFCKL